MQILKKKLLFIGVVITIFWLVMMFTLVKNHLLRERKAIPVEITPSELTLKLKNREEWMLVLFLGKKAGIHLLKITKEKGEYQVINRLRMRINLLAQTIPISMDSVVYLDNFFILNELGIEISIFSQNFHIHGLMQGIDLYLRWNFSGQENLSRIELDKQVSLYNTVVPIISNQYPLKVGKTYKISAFDPVWQNIGGEVFVHIVSKETITFNNREFDTFKIETSLGSLKTYSYALSNGTVLRQELPYGITLERIGRKNAVQLFPNLLNGPVLQRMSQKDFFSKSYRTTSPTMIKDFLTTSPRSLVLEKTQSFQFNKPLTQPTGFFGIFQTLFNNKN